MTIADGTLLIKTSSFFTYRLHNVSAVALDTFTIEESFIRLNRFSVQDQQIILLLHSLVKNRNFKRNKLIHGINLYLKYENGETININYDELLQILGKNLTMIDTLKILQNTLEQ